MVGLHWPKAAAIWFYFSFLAIVIIEYGLLVGFMACAGLVIFTIIGGLSRLATPIDRGKVP